MTDNSYLIYYSFVSIGIMVIGLPLLIRYLEKRDRKRLNKK
jgi:hypothetical protein